jgi:hypothetical protein
MKDHIAFARSLVGRDDPWAGVIETVFFKRLLGVRDSVFLDHVWPRSKNIYIIAHLFYSGVIVYTPFRA